MTIYHTHIDSPIGPLLVASDGEVLMWLSFPSGSRAFGSRPDWRPDSTPFKELRRQLAAYFSKEIQRFDLPLAPPGTAFQQAVWQELTRIPYGETRSYGDIAKALDRPKASRAVGAANGANPLPILLPCHRVIGTNGALTGFGGGIATKTWLLRHEGVISENSQMILI